MAESNFIVKNGLVVNTSFAANSTVLQANGLFVNSTFANVTGNANISGNVAIAGALTSANLTTTTANIGSVITSSVAVGANVSLDNGNNGRLFVGNSTVNATVRTTSIAIQSSDGVNSSSMFLVTELTGRSAIALSANLGAYIDFKAPGNAAEYNQRIITNTSSISILGGSSTTTANNILLRSANVGIGTTTPDATLAVSGNANVSGNTIIAGGLTSANLTTGTLYLGNSTVNSTYNSVTLSFFRTNGANNAGVDLSTTTTGAAFLELGGSSGSYIDFKSPLTDDYDQRIEANNSSISILGGSSTSTANNILLTAANVGIGTTTPDARLAVVGTANISGNTIIAGGLTSANLTTTTNTATLGTTLYSVANGNVGIGTNAPGGKLSVYAPNNTHILQLGGNSSANLPGPLFGGSISYNFLGGSRDFGFWNTDTTPPSTSFAFYQLTGASTYSNLMFITSGGNVGIGTSATVNARLAVSGTANVSGNTIIGGGLTSANLTTTTNTTTLGTTLYVVTGGNVGISNSAPDAKLAVTGTANVSGNVVIGGVLTLGNSTVNSTLSAAAFSGIGLEPTQLPRAVDLGSAAFVDIEAIQMSILTVNNATYAYGKTENNLNVNNATYAYGKTEINLNVNNALTANSSTFLGTANLNNVQTFITSNAAAAYTNAVAYVDGKAYVNTSQLSSNLANYQTTAGLSANVATLTANNATNLGGLAAASYVNTSQLSSNLANYDLKLYQVSTVSSPYTLTSADVGKLLNTTGIITVNGAVLPVGFNIRIFNNTSTTGSYANINSGTGTTMYISGFATATTSLSILERGLATITCVAANTFVITGAYVAGTGGTPPGGGGGGGEGSG